MFPRRPTRIIPCLLLHRHGLCKTVRFANASYVGDPINAVKIFNDKGADELMLVDIDATVEGRPPDFRHIEDIVSQAFMPVCYGGGCSMLDHYATLFQCGVEKVSISSAALENPELIQAAAQQFGSQSVVVTIDVKRGLLGRSYEIRTHNGRRTWSRKLDDWLQTVVEMGAGEVVLNAIDQDGTLKGYDHELLRRYSGALPIPLIALGGARDLADMEFAIAETGASAAAAGSLFVYWGPRRAVLINYPERDLGAA